MLKVHTLPHFFKHLKHTNFPTYTFADFSLFNRSRAFEFRRPISSAFTRLNYYHRTVPTMEVSNDDVQHSPQRTFQVVVAATREMGIGKDGKLPWKLPSDMKFFKEVTTTTAEPLKRNAVVMGRKTWESIPAQFRPLPGRLNVVLTRSGSFDIATAENVLICGSMNSALDLLASSPYSSSIEKVFVIGGAQVLREALDAPQCEAIHLTDIEASIDCDTFMPPINCSVFQPWYASFPTVEDKIRYAFVTYVRVRSSTTEADALPDGVGDNKIHNDKFEVEKFLFLPKMIYERHEEYNYLRLVQDIIDNGAQKNDRTGTGTLSKFGCQMRFNLRASFPLLTTKRVFWRGVVEELLWFISGSTNAKDIGSDAMLGFYKHFGEVGKISLLELMWLLHNIV